MGNMPSPGKGKCGWRRYPHRLLKNMANSTSGIEQENESASSTLCKACGLCCTGHLFVNAEFKPHEIETTQALGFNVLQSNPEKPVFTLPCHLWKGQCTIYAHPQKPSICGDFKCKLLKEVEGEELALDDALAVVEQARQMILELEMQLPVGQDRNFRRRLFEYVNQLERSNSQTDTVKTFRLKAGVLLVLFAQRFGVTGLFNKPENAKPTK